MNKRAFCIVVSCGLLAGCASSTFIGYTDTGCSQPQLNAVDVRSQAHSETDLSLLLFDDDSVRPMDAQSKSDALAYISSHGGSMSLGAGYGEGIQSASAADIQLGRKLMSEQRSRQTSIQSEDDAKKALAEFGLNIPVSTFEALESASEPTADICANTELVSPETAQVRADEASAFVASIGQRQLGLEPAAMSNGQQQIELGKFSRADRNVVHEALRLHSTAAFCAMAQDRVGKMARVFTHQINVQNNVQSDAELSAFGAQVKAARSALDAATFLVVYESAYFRNGHVVSASVDTQAMATQLVKDLPKDIQSVLDQNTAEKNALISTIDSKLQSLCQQKTGDSKSVCLLTGSLGATSFVSRSGQSIQFSGVSVSVGEKGELRPNFEYPKVASFAPQIVRVFVEALFDASAPLVPAVATSTACTNHLYPASQCLAAVTAADLAKPGSVAWTIGRIDTHAATADAFATSLTASAIRGANIAALNNEALADSIAALAGVTMRKTVEKVEWSRSAADQPGGACSRKSFLATDIRD
ncbi:hypothetical protein [Paraburkholderia antibiotica]|uniref:Uncharacterized protein n=1 Tax=Paraburkholderia antibiotica TaxID=2728839 RepID=A0A7X9X4V4_9BURK|nr:hypothetical protein [Paraburkholderia antibiotica]NML31483.1 hypothetical protein [Paraburkholderia antibiotica]